MENKLTRNTVQRKIVLDAVKKLPHPTADDIYACVHVEHPNVSRGTVYRNLNFLSDTGEIRRFGIPNSSDVFDVTTNDHFHLKCRECGKVFDICTAETVEMLINEAAKAHAFSLDGFDVVFKGVCPDCGKASENK